MRHLFALTAAAAVATGAAVTSAASAEDWNGFYVGVHVGTAISNDKWSGQDAYTYDGGEGYDEGTGWYDIGEVTVSQPFAINSNSAALTGGIDLGYDYRISNIVIGFASDVSILNGGTSRGFEGAAEDGFVRSNNSFLSTIRGRVGFVWGDVLLYGTGGGAFSNLRHHWSDGDGLTATFDLNTGWTAGGGIEWMVSPNISLNTRALFVDFGSSSAAPVDGGQEAAVHVSSSQVIWTIGLNYHL